MRTLKVLVLLLGTLLPAGCGDDADVELAPVSGKVTTKEGTPVENAVVKFHPSDTSLQIAPGSSGKTNADGEFTLRTADGQEGAMVGEHSVSISLVTDDEMDDSGKSAQNKIHPKYNERSKIKFTVTKAGSDSANFPVEFVKPKSR